MNTRVLVTGFEPFGGETVNPALEAVKRLAGRTIETSEGSIQLLTQDIPTVFGRSVEVLAKAIEETQPDVVICVGQAGGRQHITPERVAINVDDARIPDNAGQQPVDASIVADGPVAYWTGLPVKRIVQSLQAAGIPASVSNTAGTYVCNHIFYGLMHLLQTKYPKIRGGFVHIPFLPEQVVDKQAPSMSLENIVKALEITVTTTALYTTDLAIAAGAEC
ncbi:pyroglutamyl-peptidase I [Alicyclobacillus fastidiosus]|uniref:Pyrrolidone-carboxylate peptidase n=1 Tax=Alicyclobacillus fastidiosus TaxID=392011 RepID=A0ABV5AEC2_9BACL|nr:pyroglutamyl-peptidase I [Alicyclobacillus fastidiosus]WEH11942.1 pyroglutamyl-peptidase I [Alicyclobacillus fastidiosus]